MLNSVSLIVTVIFLVLVFIIYLIIIGLTARVLSANNKVTPYDLSKLGRTDLDFIERVSEMLTNSGFELDNDYKVEEDTTLKKREQMFYIRRFIHRSLGTVAYICHMPVKPGKRKLKKGMTVNNLKLETTFMSGFVIHSCMNIEPVIMNVQDELRITCTNFNKVDELIKAHINEVNKRAKREPINFDVVQTPVEAYLNKSLREIYMSQVEAGRMKYNANTGWYRLTYRGALRILLKTWQFVLFQRGKVKRQTYTGISYYSIKKMKPPLPVVLYNINSIVFILFVLVHMVFLFTPIKGDVLFDVMNVTYIVAIICFIVSLVYKITKKKE